MEITAKIVKELRDKTGAGMMDCKKALVETGGDMDAAVDYLREKGISKAAKKQSRIAAEGLSNIYIDGNKAVILEINSETDFVAKNKEFTDMVDSIGEALLKSDAKTIEEAEELKIGEDTIKDVIVNETATIGEKLSFRRFEIITKSDDEVFGNYLHMGGKIASLVVCKGKDETVSKDVAMQSAAMKPSYAFINDIEPSVLDHEKEVLTEQAINEGKPKEIAEKMVQGRLKKFYSEVCLNEQQFIKDGNVTIKDFLKNNDMELVKMVRYEVGEGLEKREENFADEVMSQIKGA